MSELEPVEVFEGMEDVGDESSEYCKSDIEFGLGRSRPDFCRMNLELESLYEVQLLCKTFKHFKVAEEEAFKDIHECY